MATTIPTRTGIFPGYGLGEDVITVGNQGRVSSLSDIAAVAKAPTQIASFTGSSTTVSGFEYDISDDSSGDLSSVLSNGNIVGIRIGGSGNPVLVATTATASSSQFILKYPLKAAVSSVQVDIYTLPRNGVFILPGTEINLSSSVTNIPSFTDIFAIPGSVRIASNTGPGIVLSESSNEVNFFGLEMGCDTNGTVRQILHLPATNVYQYACNFKVDSCNFLTQADDCIYFSGDNAGGFTLINSTLAGYYDQVRLDGHRRVTILNNIMETWTLDLGECSNIVCGRRAATSSPQSVIDIRGNTLNAFLYEVIGSGQRAAAVEVRNPLLSSDRITVQGNTITANVDSGSNDAICVNVASSATGTATPSLEVNNNQLYAASNGGSGNAYTIHSSNANYVWQRHSNTQVAGGLGSNTAAATVV